MERFILNSEVETERGGGNIYYSACWDKTDFPLWKRGTEGDLLLKNPPPPSFYKGGSVRSQIVLISPSVSGFIRTALVALFSLLAFHSAAWAETEAEIIEKVESRFAEITGMTATFSQTAFDAAMGKTEKSSGTMHLKKPMRMRWEYNAPRPQTIVADGKRLWFYFPAEKQVVTQDMRGVLNSGSPALFLAGGKRLAELFNIKFLRGAENGGTISSDALSLVPKEPSLTITRIVVRWSDDYTVRAFTVHDWTGNRSEVEFTDVKVNPAVDEKTFRFSAPKGVEVLETPKF